MKTFKKVSDALDNVIMVFCVICLVIFSVVMLVQVVLRNLFPAHALSWADGACRYSFLWASFVGCALVTKRRSQISITVITDRFKGKARKIFKLCTDLLFAAFHVIVIYEGIHGVLLTIPQKADAMSFSAAWIYAAIPVGFVLSLFQLIFTICEDITSKEIISGEEVDA